jgi:hypothetical protein
LGISEKLQKSLIALIMKRLHRFLIHSKIKRNPCLTAPFPIDGGAGKRVPNSQLFSWSRMGEEDRDHGEKEEERYQNETPTVGTR